MPPAHAPFRRYWLQNACPIWHSDQSLRRRISANSIPVPIGWLAAIAITSHDSAHISLGLQQADTTFRSTIQQHPTTRSLPGVVIIA